MKIPLKGIISLFAILGGVGLSIQLAAQAKGEKSVALRQLISQRANDYLTDLMSKRREQQQQPSSSSNSHKKKKKLPHPKKVLHYLAPKIPAIKHSPDVNLKIQTARYDIDSGVAACLIGTLARVCEV